MLRYTIVTLALCVGLLDGSCVRSRNTGLFRNDFENNGQSTLVKHGRTTDTVNAYAGVAGFLEVNFTNSVQLMQSDEAYTQLRVCDNGIIVFEQSSLTLANCPTQASLTSITNTQAFAFVAADVILESEAGVEFLADVYHILRADQYDATGNATGASICDLEIISGIIGDCEDRHRLNGTVKEALVVTWKVTNGVFGMTNYIFQAIVAVVDFGAGSETRIAFLYKDYVNQNAVNNVVKAQIHADNAGLAGTEVRYSVVCDAETDVNIHLNSNCKCALPGHYVFNTMEAAVAPHGYCGDAATRITCATQNSTSVNDGLTINRNCRNSSLPQDSCDVGLKCIRSTTTVSPPGSQVAIVLKDFGADAYAFLNYTAFTETTSGTAGFEDPHGDNIMQAITTGCAGSITPSNDSYQTINIPTILLGQTSSFCGQFDSAENSFKFVLMLYTNATGINIQNYNTQIIHGKCDFDDLPEFVNTSLQIGQVYSTTVPPRTARSVALQLWDSRNASTSPQVFTSGDTIQLGRYIYIALIVTPGTPYSLNADFYAGYATNCYLANNPWFQTDGDNRTMPIIDSTGCAMSTGPLTSSFAQSSVTPAFGQPFDVVTGGFRAFRWKMGEKKLYLRCQAKFCSNTQLFQYSKCKDSCGNTIVDANITDVDDRRRRRDVGDETEEVFLEINVEDEPVADNQHCADPEMAKAVIGALVALLILSTVMTIILFCVLQTKRK